jgi:hypothetical protein
MHCRKKTVHDMRAEFINAHFFHLYLTTSAGGAACGLCPLRAACSAAVLWLPSLLWRRVCVGVAGTYVKEFVHGDLGRTSPSIGSLLVCAERSSRCSPLSPFDD